eukprot:gnl/TRDRNA2_/TRDRNA2_174096_c1_seq22.p2 gnl/TRDRNA2_/TRDRNA2_174096_c1~~gnl/TRDRNA2_/TRDRNA2_174096_c1_seq22.p2  ORF type:complete len:262 (-),score=54.57 gnl/TRDRNA2_/TRDRNA2_174096_c1_seq22:66-851(-)
MFRLALCLTLLALAAAASAKGKSTSALRSEGFVRALEFKHRLRICNAYPYNAPLDVYRGKDSLTTEGAMPYKSCRDFNTPLKEGDKLEFRVGDASAGTFSVSGLPMNDAVLMLIIHRHDTLSTAVSFESHVFANLLNAQIAIIDTYKGRARSAARIMDAKDSKHARSEELRYDSVVAVNPGTYEVMLAGEDGSTKAKDQLVALNRESYVVLRTGVEAQQGPVYPQELVVYPKSEEPKKAGAATTTVMLSPLLIAFAAAFGW